MKPQDIAEAIEIVTLLAETLPASCRCDGGYGDDGRGTRLCLAHRALALLDGLR